mmetsp:Transcript_22739/g.71230  ORF Transcript_22739/g.71230 Transcript_22739/m.71230 type:complete len:165 (-) Transcript_22739:1928-2422(-)
MPVLAKTRPSLSRVEKGGKSSRIAHHGSRQTCSVRVDKARTRARGASRAASHVMLLGLALGRIPISSYYMSAVVSQRPHFRVAVNSCTLPMSAATPTKPGRSQASGARDSISPLRKRGASCSEDTLRVREDKSLVAVVDDVAWKWIEVDIERVGEGMGEVRVGV